MIIEQTKKAQWSFQLYGITRSTNPPGELCFWFPNKFLQAKDNVWCFVWFGTVFTIFKTWKTPMEECNCHPANKPSCQPATLLKEALLHGCSLRFLNCINDPKSRKARKKNEGDIFCSLQRAAKSPLSLARVQDVFDLRNFPKWKENYFKKSFKFFTSQKLKLNLQEFYLCFSIYALNTLALFNKVTEIYRISMTYVTHHE